MRTRERGNHCTFDQFDTLRVQQYVYGATEHTGQSSGDLGTKPASLPFSHVPRGEFLLYLHLDREQ